MTVRDSTGRVIDVVPDGHGRSACTYGDGSSAPSPVDLVGREAGALRALMLVGGPSLGLAGTGPAAEPAALAEARASLAALTDDLDDARSARQAVDAMREAVTAIDERIRRHDPASVTADEEGIEVLLGRRAATVTAHDVGRRLVPDIAHLTDRHLALQRRVGVLETSLRAQPRDDRAESDGARRRLLGRLTLARSADPEGEDVPLVLDDALLRVEGEAKWALLDLLDRCAAQCQVVYLTDDPSVTTWARRRASAGTLLLVEAVPAAVAAV